jgi:hypothetical protein
MRTTMGAMRWLVMAVVMGLGACSSEQPLSVAGDSAGPDAGVTQSADAGGPSPADADVASSPLLGRWCSPTLGELDFYADGTYAHTPPNSETQIGTWRIDATMYLTFIWSDGKASATVSVTPSTLTMFGSSGKLVYDRCP